jgi:hypothetical protein
MPGDFTPCSSIGDEIKHYAPEGVTRTVKTETTHEGFFKVGTVCIVKVPE